MSRFQGGFFLHRVDARMQQPVSDATRKYLLEHPESGTPDRLVFTTRRECPVMHLSVWGGPITDDHDAFSWHIRHTALGGALARAIGQPVWAYGYETRAGGYELVRHFSREGHPGRFEDVTKDELHTRLRLEDSDADSAYLETRLPLGKLSTKLNIRQELLREGLHAASCTVALDGSTPPDALALYLAGPLLDMPEAPHPKGLKTLELLFLSSVAEELQDLSEQLELPPGLLVWAAWEAGKARLHKDTREEDGDDGRPRSMRVPKAQPPKELTVPPQAPESPPLPASTQKVKLTVAVPKRVLNEAQALADVADRSLNWALQQAWLGARDRMRAAVRPEGR